MPYTQNPPLATDLCAHCELPLPSRAVRDEGRAFCCAGCRTVFHLVGEAGGESGWYLAKLALSAILAGNVMLFQSLLYVGSYRALGLPILHTTSWIMLGLSTAVYLLLGAPMLASALAAARRGTIGVNLLISGGSLAAIGASAISTISGRFGTYYDSATMILVLVTLGGYLDARARERATAALRDVVDGTVGAARVRKGFDSVEVPVGALSAGDIVLVRAGEKIPVDGVVRDGSSDVEESALSGESVPRRVGAGDRVFSGSTALDGALEIRSSGVTETLASRVHRLALEARARRAPIAILADRVASAFVPLVFALSAASLLGWGILGRDWRSGFLAALSVLVVACPCALGLATPLATTIALSQAAAQGVIVRSGQALEALARVRTVIFDKTGTLTAGRPAIARSTLEDAALGAAAAIEAGIVHPLASAVEIEAARRRLEVPRAQEIRSIAGGGAEGRVDGTLVLVGSRRLLRDRGIAIPVPEPPDGIELLCALDGRFAGSAVLEDTIRPEAREALSSLASDGIEVAMLSGDRKAVVATISRDLGIAGAEAELSPAGKVASIGLRRAATGGVVAMVGDGVNDAAALDAADVGVAFGNAADLAREHASVTVLGNDLRTIPRLLRLARRTLRTIRQNLFWAFFYNVAGLGLAAAGRLAPIVAAAAMVASSLLVVANSSRLRSIRL
ncbi:MAG: heavy metal translocating P-type ATPase [Thermoanaerobaculia bacterium]